MANRYWVGGTADWDGTAGTKWSTTSGGAGGASVPTASDDVYFDANSGAVTVTSASSSNVARNIDFTGFTGTLNVSSNGYKLYGDLTFSPSMTIVGSGQISLQNISTVTNIKTNGKVIPQSIFGSNANLSVKLLDDFNSTSFFYFYGGTLDFNGYNFTCSGLLYFGSSTAKTIYLRSGTIQADSFEINSNATMYEGSSTVITNKIHTTSSSATTFNKVIIGTSVSKPRYFTGLGLSIEELTVLPGPTLTFTNGVSYIIKKLIANGTPSNRVSLSVTENPAGPGTITLATPGSGYSNNQTVTVMGGNYNARVRIITLPPPTRIAVLDSGTGYTTGTYGVTGGGGSGMTVNYVEGTPATPGSVTLSSPSGLNKITYTDYQGLVVTGGAVWDASDPTNSDLGDNVGWTLDRSSGVFLPFFTSV